MKVAHLIMAYKNPTQLQMLVERLHHSDSTIYIHLDKKVDIGVFQYIASQDNVIFIVNRGICNWGGFSFVTAITNSLKEILESTKKFDYINLLSGQDYPIKPIEHFHQFLETSGGRSFISFERDENSAWWQHAVTRYERYHFTDIKIRGRYRVQALLNHLLPKRKFPLPLKLYGSAVSSWWTIKSDCAQYVVDYLERSPKLLKFMKLTWAADEFLYATIIMNSHFNVDIVNNNLRHIEWELGKANPKIFGLRDLDTLKSSPYFFARKFDPNVDCQVFEAIDQHIISSTKREDEIKPIRNAE